MNEIPDKLLSCPFCGKEAVFEYRDWNEKTETGDDGTGWIHCTGCYIYTKCDIPENLVKIWNRRIK